MTTRIDIINYLIKKNNYKTYLEIGVQNGISFRAVELPIENKVGVDPDQFSKATIHMTSDDFFKENKKTFDIIFIDGLHEYAAVYRDMISSLLILNPGGSIICHDMNPLTKEAQQVPRIQKLWNGDCWRAWVRLSQWKGKDVIKGNLKMHVVDTDHGCGIITLHEDNETSGLLIEDIDITYENLEKNRKQWLNLISVEEFKQLY